MEESDSISQGPNEIPEKHTYQSFGGENKENEENLLMDGNIDSQESILDTGSTSFSGDNIEGSTDSISFNSPSSDQDMYFKKKKKTIDYRSQGTSSQSRMDSQSMGSTGRNKGNRGNKMTKEDISELIKEMICAIIVATERDLGNDLYQITAVPRLREMIKAFGWENGSSSESHFEQILDNTRRNMDESKRSQGSQRLTLIASIKRSLTNPSICLEFFRNYKNLAFASMAAMLIPNEPSKMQLPPLDIISGIFDILMTVNKDDITTQNLSGTYIGYWLKYILCHPYSTKQTRTDASKIVAVWRYQAENSSGQDYIDEEDNSNYQNDEENSQL